MDKKNYIEALLFSKGEPVKIKEISKHLSITNEETEKEIEKLEEDLKERGIRLMRIEDKVTLASAPEASSFLEKINKEDIKNEIGKAGMEVLALVLYSSPISRREIDYIRGVNSSGTVRALLLRGLVDRVKSPSGKGFLYKPTFETLSYLGVQKTEDLPAHKELNQDITNLTTIKE